MERLMSAQRKFRRAHERETQPDREARAMKRQLERIIPTSGDVRFVCECGARFTEGHLAIAHTFDGHEVVRERFSVGAWYYFDTLTGRSVAEMIWNALREDGEEPQAFLERIQRLVAEKDAQLAAIEAAEREMGVHR